MKNLSQGKYSKYNCNVTAGHLLSRIKTDFIFPGVHFTTNCISSCSFFIPLGRPYRIYYMLKQMSDQLLMMEENILTYLVLSQLINGTLTGIWIEWLGINRFKFS